MADLKIKGDVLDELFHTFTTMAERLDCDARSPGRG